MGKRIIVPAFSFNHKPWVIIPKQTDIWYPSLVDHACITTSIGMCEEWKYPQAKGKQGYRYMQNFYNQCLETIIEEYMLTPTGKIIDPQYWNIKEIWQKVYQIYHERFNPNEV